MMNEWVMNGIDSIDDSIIEEAINYRRSRKPLYIGLGAAAAVVLLVGAGFLWGTNYMSQLTPDIYAPIAGGADEQDGEIYSGAFVGSDGDDGGFIPSDAEITYTGTAITAEEIREITEREKVTIASFIRLETPGAGDINISLSGYTHLRADDNTVSLDYVTLPVFTNDKEIIGEVTLFRYDGELHCSPAAGGNGWQAKTKVFAVDPDSKLAFVYFGSCGELIISPEDTVYYLNGYEDNGAVAAFDSVSDRYAKYATEYNTFSFGRMIADKNYVTVPAGVSNITLQ